jgi:hypothetical protein
MSRLGLTLVAVGAALVVAGVAAAGSFRGIEPTVVGGNPGCADIGLSNATQVRFASPANGSSAGGIFLFVDGNSLGWFTNGDIVVKAAIVKGGPNANVYSYPDPSVVGFSDGSLVPPLNTKTHKLYDLGAATFCY